MKLTVTFRTNSMAQTIRLQQAIETFAAAALAMSPRLAAEANGEALATALRASQAEFTDTAIQGGKG